MKRKSISYSRLHQILLPETELEYALLELPEFQIGLDWGEPRFGHPEGKVAYHVREVLDNIARLPNITDRDRKRLRIIAFAHDTFKYLEDRGSPRDWSRHHAAIARDYMTNYTSDQSILDVIGSHDDAYYAWLNERKSVEHLRHKTLESLTNRLDYCLQLFYLFFKCDTLTGDKTLAPVSWFESKATGITIVPLDRR